MANGIPAVAAVSNAGVPALDEISPSEMPGIAFPEDILLIYAKEDCCQLHLGSVLESVCSLLLQYFKHYGAGSS
jgi:hypothetical protein